jgi:hypothetical protein
MLTRDKSLSRVFEKSNSFIASWNPFMQPITNGFNFAMIVQFGETDVVAALIGFESRLFASHLFFLSFLSQFTYEIERNLIDRFS